MRQIDHFFVVINIRSINYYTVLHLFAFQMPIYI